jgi:hypothetical protein
MISSPESYECNYPSRLVDDYALAGGMLYYFGEYIKPLFQEAPCFRKAQMPLITGQQTPVTLHIIPNSMIRTDRTDLPRK